MEESKTRIGTPKTSSALSEEELSNLVHKIGHEIGNPLTAIISFATIIERFSRESAPAETEALNKKTASYAASIIDEAWKIGALSERLVMLLTHKTGSVGATDLRRALDKVIQKRQLRLHVAKDEVMVSAPGTDPIVALTDAEHISVLISELLNNAHNVLAYDFAEDAKTRPIVVMLRNDGDTCLLTVSNDSARAFPGDLSSVFDLFQTAYADRKHLGIGLGMCQAIVSRYGGSLRVIEQERRDIYSFTVELSLPRAENE